MSSTSHNPEAEKRLAEEKRRGHKYSTGEPKMHRHFGSYDVHEDEKCLSSVGGRRRVYIFDADALEEHERWIKERVWEEAYRRGLSDGKALEVHTDKPIPWNPYRA